MFKNLLPVLLALSALPAGATTTFYVGATGPTGLAGFTSDLLTRGLTVGSMINFTGESSGTNVLDVGGTGVNFTGSSSMLVDVLSPTNSILTLSAGSALLQINMPSNVYAIGMYIQGTATDKTWTYGPSGGTITLNNSAPIFFGAMSDLPLASLPTLTLAGPGSTTGVSILNFQIGTVTPTGPPPGGEAPEPSTFALVGTGLIAFPWIARRRRTRPASAR